MRTGGDQSASLAALAAMAPLAQADLFVRLDSSAEGLDASQAQSRLRTQGPNRIAEEAGQSLLREIWRRMRTPLNGLLIALAAVSWFLSDIRSALVIAVMVSLSVGLGFIQEHHCMKPLWLKVKSAGLRVCSNRFFMSRMPSTVPRSSR